MIARWPSELDPPMQEGWRRQAGDARRRSSTDSGPQRISRRFSRVARPVSIVLDLSRAQLSRFWRFYFEEAREGSQPFLMPDPTTAGWALLTDDGSALLTDEGLPLLLDETWVCLFGDQLPSETIYGVRFRVSFEIAVMP